MANSRPSDVVIVGNFSDDPFAIDVAFAVGQTEDIADLIAMKTFANTEFCPRFISDEEDFTKIGRKLEGKTVVIVSTSSRVVSRQNLAMRNMLIARAAKENGAREVMLVEPDLYYSAQDRGPRPEHGETQFERSKEDLKKFDGQPFTAKLYAEMLKLAGVDSVLTVHNHSYSVQSMFSEVFGGRFHNLIPYEIYTDYLRHSNLVNCGPQGEGLALCAPDKGARDFVKEMYCQLGLPKAKFILLDKERSGERDVQIKLHDESEIHFRGDRRPRHRPVRRHGPYRVYGGEVVPVPETDPPGPYGFCSQPFLRQRGRPGEDGQHRHRRDPDPQHHAHHSEPG